MISKHKRRNSSRKQNQQWPSKISDNMSVHRRFTLTGTITSTVAGLIQYSFSSASLQATPYPDFAAFQGLYQTYRANKFRLTLIPLQSQSLTVTGGLLVVAKWSNDNYNNLTTVQSCLESSGRDVVNVLVPDTYVCTASLAGRNHLFSRINVAQNSEETFGVTLQASGVTASTNYFTYVLDWDVEFRQGL
jgi:hypothetical protein